MKNEKLKKNKFPKRATIAALFLFPFSFFLFNFAAAKACGAEEKKNPYFVITVVDDQTGRGVPLVELRTVSEMKFYTDSNGIIAFNEPGLMDRKVFFHVKSHGYEFPADGFGMRGQALDVKAGKSVTLRIKRINIAERLYRITGEGIYRDSVLAGLPVPIKEPLLNAQVSGQDSVQMTEYRGKLYWFWGDTNRPGFPLGHFGTSGATSLKPADGGLDPAKGVDLTYFTGKDGFSRPMVGGSEPGLRWIDGVLTVADDAGNERLVAKCSRMKSLGEVYERTLIVYNDKTNQFETLAKLPANNPRSMAGSNGQAIRWRDGDQEYFLFCAPYASVRVKADWKSVSDPESYEAFTCLAPGTYPPFNKEAPARVDRDADGKVRWAWKKNTAPINWKEQQELLKAKLLKEDELWYKIADSDTGKPIHGHGGSMHYNANRKKWIMLLQQFGGSSSLLGEIWYSEAPSPEGPWERARKIMTHEKYTFYNVAHHPEFDQDGGRVIFFEGTYTAMFSGNPEHTPRYEYNQIMYRLDLADERLKMNP